MELNQIYNEDCLETMTRMDDESVDCCITSPPYWGLRDYGVNGQLGLEKTPEEYVKKMVSIFQGIRGVLKDEGTVWLNLGDSYSSDSIGQSHFGEGKGEKTIKRPGYVLQNKQNENIKVIKPLPSKNLLGMPWRVAFALQADGWYLRSDIIWSKPNPMPESVTDRPTKAHEYIFLLTKSPKYYYDADAIAEQIAESTQKDYRLGWYEAELQERGSPKGKQHGGELLQPKNRKQDMVGKNTYTGFNDRYQPVQKANKRTVWNIPTYPFPEAHFAVFPEKLIEPCILAGCPKDGIVYDPFMGAGTTALVALRAERNFIGSELNPEYCDIANKRIKPLLDQYKLVL